MCLMYGYLIHSVPIEMTCSNNQIMFVCEEDTYMNNTSLYGQA